MRPRKPIRAKDYRNAIETAIWAYPDNDERVLLLQSIMAKAEINSVERDEISSDDWDKFIECLVEFQELDMTQLVLATRINGTRARQLRERALFEGLIRIEVRKPKDKPGRPRIVMILVED